MTLDAGAGVIPELRVGVVGVGVMGADHAERLVRRIGGARLVAVADPVLDRAQALAAHLGEIGGAPVRALADPLALVADDEVDAVVLASPGSAHPPQLAACLGTGTPVLCEKPLTMDGDSSLEVVRAEADLGRRLVQVGFMRRFDPEYVAAKEILDSGRLGRVLLVHHVHRNQAPPHPGFAAEMAVRDSLVHEIDITRYLVGEEVTSIAVMSGRATSAARPGVHDPQVAVMRTRGDVLVTAEVFIASRTGYEVRCEVVCEGGTVVVGRPAAGVYVTEAHDGRAGSWGGEVPGDYRARFALAYDRQVQAWVDACRRGEGVGAGAWDGYAATAVAEAGMTSMWAGGAVEVALSERPSATSH